MNQNMRNTFSNISNIKERKENLNNEKKNAIDFSNLSVSEVVKNKDQNQFVFSINKVKIMYDNEEATILYFKDVTFGVLYEQIKAQKSF